MRISDWSSDVCSSDLIVIGAEAVLACDREAHLMQAGLDLILAIDRVRRGQERAIGLAAEHIIARRSTDLDRKSVVEGKSVSVRVDLGGRRYDQKRNK